MLKEIEQKVLSKKRLTSAEGLYLLTEADLMDVARLAQWVRHEKHSGNQVTYIIDSNPNYTNVCVADCLFCAFYRRPGDKEAYTLSVEQVMEKIKKGRGPRRYYGIAFKAVLNPELPLEYYTTLIHETRKRFPQLTPHFFTASEVLMMAEVSHKPIAAVLSALKEAGQVSLPGGGAEVLSEYVRKRISPKKTQIMAG